MADDTTKIIKIVIDSRAAIDGGRAAQRALEQIEKQVGTTAAALEKMENGLDLVATIGKIVATGVVLKGFIDNLLNIFKAARDAGAGVSDFSEQVGMSTRFVQGSMFAAAHNTIAIDKLGVAYTKASQVIGNAANGQKDSIELMDRLGVKILDTAGRVRSTESILQDAAAGILRIEDPARRVAAAMEFFGKSGTQLIPMLGDIAAGSDYMSSRAEAAGAMMEESVIKQLAKLKSQSEESALKWNALVATLGAPIATRSLEGFNALLKETLDLIRRTEGIGGFLEGALENSRRNGRMGGLRLSAPEEIRADREAQLRKELASGNPANAGREDMIREDLARVTKAQRDAAINRQADMESDEDWARRFKLSPLAPPGARNPVPKGTGDDEAKKYQKLIAQLGLAADAQDKMTAAARRGEVAMTEQEVKLKAAEKALDLFGKVLEATDPRLQKIEELMRRSALGKLAEQFNAATTALRDQNAVLEVELRLLDAAPDVRARELAIIKATNDAKKAGTALTADDIEQRRTEIDLNERRKAQIEEKKKLHELWTAPLRSALESIQRTGADAFEQLFESGKLSAESLGQVFAKMVRRMAAEFAALALIRPVMGVVVEGAGNAGLIGQNTVRQLGYGGVGGGGIGGGGGLAAMGGGSTGFFNQPISSSFMSWDDEIANWSTYGTSAQNSLGGPLSGLGNMSWGSALAGIGSIGMGAYSMATSKGAGGMIGGAAGILGGDMGLLSSMGVIGSAFGPIGMGVGLIGGLLGGLLGGSDEPPIPKQPDLSLGVGSFMPRGASSGYGFGGGSSLAKEAGGIGSAVSRLFRQAGVTGVQGSMYGGRIWSGVDNVLNGRQWQARPYTQVGLVTPGGEQEMVTYNDSSRNMQQAADLLIAAVFKANIQRGGVTGASSTLKSALAAIDPTTAEDTANIVAMSVAYEKLGKAANPLKDSLDQLGASFDELTDFAERAGLAMEPINAELAKQNKRMAQDFIDSMLDPMAVQMRALEDERKSAFASAEYIRDHIKDVYVDMDRIATFYTNREAALREQFYAGAVSSLEQLIKRLTYGDLANASADTSLSGTRASYNATLAQARAGSTSAMSNLAGAAEAYAGSARSYFSSSAEYAAIVDQLRRDLEERVAVATGGADAGNGGSTTNAATNAVLASNAELRDMFRQSQNDNAALREQLSVLVAQLARKL